MRLKWCVYFPNITHFSEIQFLEWECLASSENQTPLQYLGLHPPNLRHHKSHQALIGSIS